MTWLSLLFMLIRLLPDIISLIQKLIEAFRDGKLTDAEFAEVREAARHARRTGDQAKVRDVLSKIHDRLNRP